MYNYSSVTGTPQLVPPLAISSTTTDSIVVSWTAPQTPPIGYSTDTSCKLLCGDPLPATNALLITVYDTSMNISNLPPGSECNITLSAQYGTASSNELMVTATTLSKSQWLVSVNLCSMLFCHIPTSMSLSYGN